MLKKNKLPILLLAVVAMLSVFYIYANNTGAVDATRPDTDRVPGQTVHPVLAEQRLRLLQERTDYILDIEAAIAQGDLTKEQIAVKVARINDVFNLKAKEVSLENEIVRRFRFEEVLVEIANQNIYIDVVLNQGDTIDALDFISIHDVASEKLDNCQTILTPVFRN